MKLIITGKRCYCYKCSTISYSSGPSCSKQGKVNPGLVQYFHFRYESLRSKFSFILFPTIWLLGALKGREKIIRENAFEQKKKKPGLKFNFGLALIGLQTTGHSCTLFKGGGISSGANPHFCSLESTRVTTTVLLFFCPSLTLLFVLYKMSLLVPFAGKVSFTVCKGSVMLAAMADHILFAKVFSGAGGLVLGPGNTKFSLVICRSHGS